MREINYVEWMDSATTHGWIEAENVCKTSRIGHCCTVGFLVDEDAEQLVLALNAACDENTCPVGDIIAIPKCCITVRRTSAPTDDQLSRLARLIATT